MDEGTEGTSSKSKGAIPGATGIGIAIGCALTDAFFRSHKLIGLGTAELLVGLVVGCFLFAQLSHAVG